MVFVPALPGSGRSTLARSLAQTLAEAGNTVRSLSLRQTADRQWLRNALHTLNANSPLHLVIDDAEWAALFPLLFRARSVGPSLRLICMVPEQVPPAVDVITHSKYRVGRFHGLSPRCLLQESPDSWPLMWNRGSLARSLAAESEQAGLAYRKRLILQQCLRNAPPRPTRPRRRSHEDIMIRIRRLSAEIKAAAELEEVIAGNPRLRRFYNPRSTDDATLPTFLSLAATAAGGVVNYSGLGRSYGVSHETARAYTALLERALLLELQPPYCPPSRKRLVRRPRLLFPDNGVLHAALGIESADRLLEHIQAESSWRNFVVSLVARTVRLPISRLPFWSSHTGAWVDALWWPGASGRTATSRVPPSGRPHAVLATLEGNPGITRIMRIARDDLDLERLWVVCPGNRSFDLDDRVRVLTIREFATAELPAAHLATAELPAAQTPTVC